MNRRAPGFSLVELLIAIGLALVYMNLMMFVVGHQLEGGVRIEAMAVINEIRSSIISRLDNVKVWNATKAADPSFLCLINNLPCDLAPKPFSIIDTTGEPVLLSFSAGGFLCTTGQCAATYIMTWEPICAGGLPCVPTQIRIRGTLTVLDERAMPKVLNRASHGIVLLRSVN
jgi:hypothetical protein